ncbi:MAG: uroporphyrinogen-III synthase, partial [Planctomycetota bacterium]
MTAVDPTAVRALPLYRRRVVVTRPRVRSSAWVRGFADVGADVIPFPTFELALPDAEGCGAILAELSAPLKSAAWLAVTSPTSAEHLLNLVERHRVAGGGASLLDGYRWAAVGEGTAKILEDRGFTVDLTATDPNAVGLADALLTTGVAPGTRVWHVSSSRGRPEFVERLVGAEVDARALHVSRHRPIAGLTTRVLERELDGDGVDLFTYASPSAAEHLLEIAPPAVRGRILAVPALAAGQTTHAALTELGFATITTAASPRV